MRKHTKASFIKKARAVHGDKYDYYPTKYVNAQTKVIINCPDHGSFEQIPNNHLRGSGCPECVGKLKKTTAQFIKDAKVVHGDRYDYSPTKYVNKATKVIIKERQARDEAKRKEAKRLGIPLIEIPYWERKNGNLYGFLIRELNKIASVERKIELQYTNQLPGIQARLAL